MTDTFPAEEYGSGSRATLTPTDRAFLESPPTYPPSYEEGESPSLVEPIALRSEPTPARRVSSLLLFTVIAGGSTLVLVLALLRTGWRALFP